jgi:hypothetical protein
MNILLLSNSLFYFMIVIVHLNRNIPKPLIGHIRCKYRNDDVIEIKTNSILKDEMINKLSKNGNQAYIPMNIHPIPVFYYYY